jgi:hypothetical protein
MQTQEQDRLFAPKLSGASVRKSTKDLLDNSGGGIYLWYTTGDDDETAD